MIAVFLRFFNLSVMAGWMVLAVLLLRLCLKKAPRWITCVLWGLVALRLLVPFTIESPLSLIPTAETVVSGDADTSAPVVNSGVASLDKPLNDWLQTPVVPPTAPSDTDTGENTDTPVAPVDPKPEEQKPSEQPAPDTATTVSRMERILNIAVPVWLVGIGLMLAYELFSVIRVRRRVLDAVLLRDNVWQSDRVSSPFIFGLFRPRIYVPYDLEEPMLEQVLSHERAHLHRRDHWIKPFAFTLLAVYWYNPLLWVGYILLCRDIEVACDERVVRGLDEDTRRQYATALLQCGVERRSIAACPLAFGEVSIKQRIKSVLSYRKPLLWVIIVSLVACSVAAVCLLTVPTKPDSSDDDSGTLQQNPNATTYIPYDTEQSTEYNNAISIYNSFLNGLIPVQGDAAYYITDIVRGSDGKSGIDSYALADVNQDNVPELFFHAMSKDVLGVVDGKLTCWYSSGGSVKVSLLENGALFTTSLNSPDYHAYITFDKQGAKNEVWFNKGATGPTAPTTYVYKGDSVTKEEWEFLTAPYFAQAEKTVELQWFKWSESTTTTTTTTNTNDTSTELMTLAIVEEVPDDALLYEDTSAGTYNYTLALTAQQDLSTVQVAKVYQSSAADVIPLYTLRTLLKGETLYVRTCIKDTVPKPGVAFKDKNNMVYAYAFVYSVKDGSVQLQLQWKAEDTNTYVATEEDKAALTAMVTDKDNNGFLQSNYNYSDEISLSALFYDGAGVGTFGTADWSEQEKQDVLTATGWDDFHNPPLKIKRTDANRFIKDKLSPYANPTDEKMYEAFCYVSKYDAFYAMHGDTNYTAVTVKDVQYDPKGYFAVTYTVEGATPVEGVVTLSRTDTGFRFRSNSRADLSKSATPKMEYTPPKTYSGKNVADATGVPYSNAAPKEMTNQMAREILEVLLPRQKDVRMVWKHQVLEYDEEQTCACSEWSYRVTDSRFKTMQDVRNFILSVYTGDVAEWCISGMLGAEGNETNYFHEHNDVLYYCGGASGGLLELERLWDTTHIVWVKGDVVWVEMHARYDETKEYDHVYTFALCKTADGWRTYSGFMDSYYPS